MPLSCHTDFDPETGIPDLSEKVCLVTGGNSGLGEATLAALALHNPGRLWLAARSRPKAEAAVSRIKASSPVAASANIEILDLDLASLDSVKAAAARFDAESDRLDLLHLTGGVGMVPAGMTKDGYEIEFGTNYLGHALLTQLLMPKLLATATRPAADVRVISMSSIGHRFLGAREGIFFSELKTDMSSRGGPALYAQAMLAKALFAHELAKRYPHITAASLHPGTVKSGVWGGEKDVNFLVANLVRGVVALTGVSNAEGAKNGLWCSFSGEVQSGRYYEPIGKLGNDGKNTRNDSLAVRLWEWTESELQGYGTPGWPDGIHEAAL